MQLTITGLRPMLTTLTSARATGELRSSRSTRTTLPDARSDRRGSPPRTWVGTVAHEALAVQWMLRRRVLSRFRRGVTAALGLLCIGESSACVDEVRPVDYLARCGDGFIDGACPTGCEPVVSVNSWSPERSCAKDGVVLGCAPDMWSEYWSTHGYNELHRFCDRLTSDPQYYVCFQGTPSIQWVLGHLDLFCINSDCPEQTLVCQVDN